ncbi:uridine kinase [Cavenderia fasciculata]|uniref:Uridine-cytidine kinase n=1 Tax=Cavenderia fasciculata TaxID=261658 RepID=F4PU21_CACFS|nr:uridine kinase [Cavenderia fasciculata]EGG21789.1 uridine kinase [Cavenderia fasciculata]|eukprot:XP_004359639.1 uridine kinase [Cavenderia fasciculata]
MSRDHRDDEQNNDDNNTTTAETTIVFSEQNNSLLDEDDYDDGKQQVDLEKNGGGGGGKGKKKDGNKEYERLENGCDDKTNKFITKSDEWPPWKRNLAAGIWIVIFVSLNLSLSFANKYLFTIGFMNPVFVILTGTFVTFVGSCICVFGFKMSTFPKAALKRRWKMILLCSTFQALTYVLENISIISIPISLNQIIKATAPAFIIFFQILIEGVRFDATSIVCTVIIIIGAALSVVKNPSFDKWGFFYSLASTIFAVLQSILISSLQKDKDLTTLSIVLCTSLPSVFVIIPIWAYKELPSLIHDPYPDPLKPWLIVGALAFAAFFYNLSHFYIIKYTSALYYAIVGNAKIILLIVISSVIFHTSYVAINYVGMGLTLAGFFAYNIIKYRQKVFDSNSTIDHTEASDCESNNNNNNNNNGICLDILNRLGNNNNNNNYNNNKSPKRKNATPKSQNQSPLLHSSPLPNQSSINNNDKFTYFKLIIIIIIINQPTNQIISNPSNIQFQRLDNRIYSNLLLYSSSYYYSKMLMICIAGGTASGKTTVCEEIIKRLENKRISVICLDSFYRPLTHDELTTVASYNFDHPSAFDWDYATRAIKELKSGNHFNIPTYCFKTHNRLEETTPIADIDVIIFEGILSLYTQEIRDQMDIKIFVDTDSDTRLSRRVLRDIAERGRNLEGVLYQYEKFVKPSFDEYILPTKKYADVIIPRGADNVVAIDLIVRHIRSKLQDKDNNMKPNSVGNH